MLNCCVYQNPIYCVGSHGEAKGCCPGTHKCGQNACEPKGKDKASFKFYI
uniref:Uncharacterized protein n=1 Tax=Meloidogyne enterolobii TaxID=390850 RepID=A0A6V7UHK1_MELEN|nr:unnamed protein product [Meloidogyne enterolobii]